MLVIATLIALAFLLLLPSDALAWGAATHLEIARAAVESSWAMPAHVKELISLYRYDFFYGNISADIVIGKNLVHDLKHCHHWKAGFKLLKQARTDAQKAFAYGYLCHLAADTVAHNHFIPEMMIRSYSTRLLKHTYWELRFDALADRAVWQIPKKIVKEVHRENDRILDDIFEETPLSFRTNKTIFSSIMLLGRVEHWHRMLGLLSKNSRWRLEQEERDRYLGLSIEAVKGLLELGQKAPCIRKDPTGKAHLYAAKATRTKLKVAKWRGLDMEEEVRKALKWIALR